MFNLFKKVFVLFCLFILLGCSSSGNHRNTNGQLFAPTKNIRTASQGDPYKTQPLPKSYTPITLYMEQWDALAQHIADEIVYGLGQRKTINVAGSGITSFKKGFRELLITALTRRGIAVVDRDVDTPVLEFDLLPFAESQKKFFIGKRNLPTQIMVNTSILDHGQYIYRNSTVYAVPREELYDYIEIEDERQQQAPFKTYQLVAS